MEWRLAVDAPHHRHHGGDGGAGRVLPWQAGVHSAHRRPAIGHGRPAEPYAQGDVAGQAWQDHGHERRGAGPKRGALHDHRQSGCGADLRTDGMYGSDQAVLPAARRQAADHHRCGRGLPAARPAAWHERLGDRRQAVGHRPVRRTEERRDARGQTQDFAAVLGRHCLFGAEQ